MSPQVFVSSKIYIFHCHCDFSAIFKCIIVVDVIIVVAESTLDPRPWPSPTVQLAIHNGVGKQRMIALQQNIDGRNGDQNGVVEMGKSVLMKIRY